MSLEQQFVDRMLECCGIHREGDGFNSSKVYDPVAFEKLTRQLFHPVRSSGDIVMVDNRGAVPKLTFHKSKPK